MVLVPKTLLFLLFFESATSNLNVTKILPRADVFLSRKKRYLTFPMGSNFVITISGVKAFMQVQPTGWNFLIECDVPFALPSDASFFRKKNKKKLLQKREIYSKIRDTLMGNNINGDACLRRMICEAKMLATTNGKSMVKDLLKAIFQVEEEETNFNDACDTTNFESCDIPILDILLNMSPSQ